MTHDRPWVDFAQCKAAISFPQVLETFGIADQFVIRQDTVTGPCPLPQHVHNSVRPNRQQFKAHKKASYWLYKCFGDCSSHPHGGGDIIQFIKAMLQCSDAHCRLWLAENFGEQLTGTRSSNKKAGGDMGQVRHTPADSSEETGQVSASPADSPGIVSGSLPPLKPLRFHLNVDVEGALPYLASRGLTDEGIIRRYGLGLARRGVLKDFLAIPVHRWPREDPAENPCGYIGRYPGDFEAAGQPRYKVPAGFPVSRCVFGLNEALEVSSDSAPLIIVEGPLTAVWLAQAGFTTAVALLKVDGRLHEVGASLCRAFAT